MTNFTPEILKDAAELNIPLSELKQAYNKGVCAWTKETVPGSNPEQLGYAVVEQYIILVREKKEREESDKDKDNKKKDTKKKNIAYSNKQPADTYSSARMGGISGGFFGSMNENLDNFPTNIKTWMLSEKTQDSYKKKYGNKAKSKLLEAATKLQISLVETKKSVAKNEPKELLEMPNSKRKNYELGNWHLKQAKLYENNDLDLYNHHMKLSEEYNKKH